MALAWLACAALSVTAGVLAVITVGDSLRDRGPLGNETIRNAELVDGQARPDPDAPAVRDSIDGEWGEFVVECREVYAIGVEAMPDTASGWQTVSFEPGPDDDVDAVFVNGDRSVELEIICHRGQPTIADLEWKTLPVDD
jgi:hypothetical protein